MLTNTKWHSKTEALMFFVFPQRARQLKAASSHFPISWRAEDAGTRKPMVQAVGYFAISTALGFSKSSISFRVSSRDSLVHATRICSGSDSVRTVNTARALQPRYKGFLLPVLQWTRKLQDPDGTTTEGTKTSSPDLLKKNENNLKRLSRKISKPKQLLKREEHFDVLFFGISIIKK